jgi:hypothetical protein
MGGGRIKENVGGVNSRMMYYENFCECHSVPPAQQFKNVFQISSLLKVNINTFSFGDCKISGIFYISTAVSICSLLNYSHP